MTYGQVDPARLEGEALRRWYSRSPAEIRDERTAAVVRRYDEFFLAANGAWHGTGEGRDAPSSIHERGSVDLDNFRRSQWPGRDRAQAKSLSRRPSVVHQAAAVEHAPRVPHRTPRSCLSCHGHAPRPPLPPPFGTFPLPPGTFPSLRGRLGPPQSGSSGGNPKQCVVQYENDAEICRRLPGMDSRRRCWESAAEREVYCNKSKGEVGYPPLRN